MHSRNSWLFLTVVVAAASAWAQPVIDASNWPYGSDQIGNHWSYYNTSSDTPVNISSLNPYQSGAAWDFGTGPTGALASSEIRAVNQAPTPTPPNTTFTEYQVSGSNTQWVYEDENVTGTWARGFWQQGTVYNYDPPQWNIYHYPMTYGSTWTSAWTWGESQLGVPMQETRTDSIVGWGTVTTPFGGPMPCLVMRTHQTTYAEYMGVPLIDDEYRIYEWLVPGIGSVATIQSVNQESSWYFTTASGFYRLYDSNLGGDVAGPSITGVTILSDTPSPGPYSVSATISDPSSVDSAALYYSVAAGPFTAVGPQTVNGGTYTFQIPALSGSPVQQVRYYVWGRDASANHNIARDPVNAPAAYYSFNWINDNIPPAFTGVTIWPSPTNFNGPYPVSATITDDRGILFASLHYKFGSGNWQEAGADSNNGNVYHFTIPGISATTIIRYYLEAVDNSGFFNTGYYPAAGVNGPIVFQAVYTAPAAPRAITDLTAARSGNDVRLDWSDVTQDINGNPVVISHYDVYRGTSSDGSDWVVIASPTSSIYVDPNALSTGTHFIYNVRAVSQ